jgi:predicted transcriptional regulator
MEVLEREIGDAAGKVWKALKAKGPLPKTKIPKAAGISPQVANQAIGWLAREGKLTLQKEKMSDLIGLRE